MRQSKRRRLDQPQIKLGRLERREMFEDDPVSAAKSAADRIIAQMRKDREAAKLPRSLDGQA